MNLKVLSDALVKLTLYKSYELIFSRTVFRMWISGYIIGLIFYSLLILKFYCLNSWLCSEKSKIMKCH